MLTAMLTAITLLSGCAMSTDAHSWHDRWGGPLERYSEVFDESDCEVLEALIVRESGQMGRQLADNERRDRSSIIQAAFRRLVDLQCAQAFQ